MVGRVISLTDYRDLRLAGSKRETEKVRSSRVNLKAASHSRPMKSRRRLVGSPVDSMDPAKADLTFSRAYVSPKWDRRYLFATWFFVGCLALVAFGL